MQLTPDQQKVSAYYNLDNGTGRLRGIYLQGNAALRPVFTAWLEPFKDMGATTVTINNTGSTDHVAFDAVGIPGFQFIQDPIEYNTRTHHTNMDTYDHLVPEDLKQASVIVASFVYNTAMRDEKLPRKELPKPRGELRGF
jgi:Zn-dependent M28 family amino/carboxypeptidase